MQIRGLQNCAGLNFALSVGEVQDFSDELAISLISDGLAEAVNPSDLLKSGDDQTPPAPSAIIPPIEETATVDTTGTETATVSTATEETATGTGGPFDDLDLDDTTGTETVPVGTVPVETAKGGTIKGAPLKQKTSAK